MKVKFCNVPIKFRGIIKKVANATCEQLGQPSELVVYLTKTDETQIRELNKDFRNIDKETDVLSFPTIDNLNKMPIVTAEHPFETDEKTGLLNLGDIFICENVALRQAKEFGHSEKREIVFLFLHGLLHLFGFDHIEEKDEAEMKAQAEVILKACSVER